MQYPKDLLTLIAYLRKLPGVGTKTAERFAFQLLDWPESQLENFSFLIQNIKKMIHHCSECGCLKDKETCFSCQGTDRQRDLLCIVSSAKDVYAIEETRVFRGLYHVLGGLLSPIHGCTPEQLNLSGLKKRIEIDAIKEVIIALDSTLEGDATTLYMKEQLATWNIPTSRLAFGLPLGSSLDFVDGGTLTRALMGRQFL